MKTASMKVASITHRLCDKKRHTKAYLVDGERMTRGAVVKMARRGKIADVIARRSPSGWYIASHPRTATKLYDLPTVVEA